MLLKPSIALLRTQSDERLVALARDGSEAAFQAIVERYRRQVLGACRRILPESRAEDATQQVFVSAWRALGRGDDVLDVRPWLLRIARNTALNALRTQGYDYDELREGLSVGEAPQAELERRDVIRQTLAGLAALPERQREALLRSAVEGASHADIAKSLGLSEGATRQLVLRARTALRSAATAVTPWAMISWVAQASTGAPGGGAAAVDRIAEVAAGGGAAGASALLAKTGAVAVLAGTVVAGPAVVSDRAGRDTKAGRAAVAAAVAAPQAAQAGAEAVSNRGAEGRRRGGRSSESSRGDAARGGLRAERRRRRARGERGDDDRSTGDARRRGSDDAEHSGGATSGGSHHDSSDDGPTAAPTGETGTSGSGSGDDPATDDHSGSGGSGSSSGPGGGSPEPTPTPSATASPQPTGTPGSDGRSGSGDSGTGGSPSDDG